MSLTSNRKMSTLSTPGSLHSSPSLSRRLQRSNLSYHTQNLLLYPYSPSFDEDDDKDESTSPLLEALYLFLMAGTGIILGYLASNVAWPESFAPFLGLGLLCYLFTTHTSFYSPFVGRYAIPHRDEESAYTVVEKAAVNKIESKNADAESRENRLKAILAEKRKGRLAGVFAFGPSSRERSGMAGGRGPLWVIVEDMDARERGV